MRVELVALPQEISVAQAECCRGDCELESLALVYSTDRTDAVRAMSASASHTHRRTHTYIHILTTYY